MDSAIDLLGACASLTEYWSPRVVGTLNGDYVKVAKVRGTFTWHKHDDQDEFFLVLRGELEIAFEGGRSVTLRPGQFYVVPRNTLHCPSAAQECCIALIEPQETKHTGDVVSPLTRSIEAQLGEGA
ncbi:MAG: cupin domain-containing protein [bacterium]|nr:cupin domain-containing protein [bacterium]